MGEVNKVNVSLLKSLNRDFKKEMNNFNNKAYDAFSNSYINRCSDPIIMKMKNSLNSHYNKIKKGYKNIDSWWEDYNSNIESVENYLSGRGGIEQIQESSVKATAGALPLLGVSINNSKGSITKTKRSDTSKMFASREVQSTSLNYNGSKNLDKSVKDSTKGVHSWMQSIASDLEKFASSSGAVVGSAVSSLQDSISKWSSKANAWWNDEALPTLGIAKKNIDTVVNKTGATVANGAQSLVEGVSKFGETVVDTVALAGTGVASVATGLYDGGKALKGTITGEEWTSTTKAMWENTKCFVKKDYVTSFFDDIYDNTAYGNWLNENAIAKDAVRSVGNGIGYVSGVVALSMATAGLGGTLTTAANGGVQASSLTMAGVSGTLGVAKGTEKAWGNGASTIEGLGAGALSGLWEGTQFYVGGKINMTNVVTGDGVKNQVINGLARVTLDSVDSGLDGFVDPLIGTIYKKGYYDETGKYIEFYDNQSFSSKYSKNFQENGGFEAVATNAIIGGGMSFLSEGVGLAKSLKNDQSIKNVHTSIDHLNELDNNTKKLFSDIDTLQEKNIDVIQTNGRNTSLIQKEIDDILDNNPELRKILEAQKSGQKVDIDANIHNDYIKLKNLEQELGISNEVSFKSAAPIEGIAKEISKNRDSIASRLKAAIGNADEYNKVLREIASYTEDNLPPNFSSLSNLKKSIANDLKTSGALDDMPNNYFFALLSDIELMRGFIGTDKLSYFLEKNLHRVPDYCIPVFRNLTDQDLSGIFDTHRVKEYFASLTDTDYLNILSIFNKNNSNALLVSSTFNDRFFNVESNTFREFLESDYSIYGLLSNNKNKNGQNFLQRILDNCANEEYLLSHPNLAKRLKSMIPYSEEFDSYREVVDDIYNKVQDELRRKLISNADIELPSNGRIKMDKMYYDLIYSINGETKVTCIDCGSFYGYDLLSAFGDSYNDILDGNVKIISIKENVLRNALKISDIQTSGLHDITLEIDGEVEHVVKKISFGSCDLSNDFEKRNITSAKVLLVTPLAKESYNFACENADSIFKLTYMIDGVEYTKHFIPSYGEVDIDFYITLKNLYNIENVKIEPIDVDASVRENANIFKYKNSNEVFSSVKYGGNQSDVSRIVVTSLEGELTDSIDVAKSELLIDLIRKYYPDAAETDIKNIARSYEEAGCGYMAVANDFITYMASLENGVEQFKEKLGYNLFETDGNNKSYNFEALALEIFLNSHKNVMEYTDISTLLEKAEGVNGFSYAPFINDFFAKKNVGVEIDFTTTRNMTDVISNMLDKKGCFNILTASGFDLTSLSKEEITKSADGALANSQIIGGTIKDIGGHAMSITGMTDLNELIVSSWGKVFKFIPNKKGPSLVTVKFDINGG